MVGSVLGSSPRHPGDPQDDRHHGAHLERPDALAEHAVAEDQEQQQTAGERRLNDRERRQQQRDDVEGPPRDAEEGREHPSRPGHEPPEERRPQGVVVGDIASLHRLQRHSEVEEDRRHAGARDADLAGRTCLAGMIGLGLWAACA